MLCCVSLLDWWSQLTAAVQQLLSRDLLVAHHAHDGTQAGAGAEAMSVGLLLLLLPLPLGKPGQRHRRQQRGYKTRTASGGLSKPHPAAI